MREITSGSVSLFDRQGRVKITPSLYHLTRLARVKIGERLIFSVPVGYGFRVELARNHWLIHSYNCTQGAPLELDDIQPLESGTLHPMATARLEGEPIIAMILLPRLFTSLEILLRARLHAYKSNLSEQTVVSLCFERDCI